MDIYLDNKKRKHFLEFETLQNTSNHSWFYNHFGLINNGFIIMAYNKNL